MASPEGVPQVPLGSQGLMVSAQGLGCMGMSAFYSGFEGEEKQKESLAVIEKALELGVNHLDTAEIYGPYTNEELVGKAISGKRDKFVVATKFGFKINGAEINSMDSSGENVQRACEASSERLVVDCITSMDSSRENVRRACEASLKRLGVDCIDLFYQHRVDPNTPIEETMQELKALVEEGKVKYVGLSEANAKDIRKAHAVHPISALQIEWSIWSRDVEEEIVPLCRELGIGIVAYSPLGRGYLTGAFEKPEDLSEDDWRRKNPRFTQEAFERNKKIVDAVKAVAERKGCTPAQVALAWLHHQGADVVPIPGTKRLKYLLDNVGAYHVKLTAEDMKELDFGEHEIHGHRYDKEFMKAIGTFQAYGTNK